MGDLDKLRDQLESLRQAYGDQLNELNKKFSSMKKYWETLVNAESEEATWEIVVDEKKENIRLEFWNCENCDGKDELLEKMTELKLSREQFEELLLFAKKLDRNV